jgi:hypothetical protein
MVRHEGLSASYKPEQPENALAMFAFRPSSRSFPVWVMAYEISRAWKD